jgi:hypothetical protein
MAEDKIEDLCGQPLVEPLDDNEIVLNLVRIRGLGNRGDGDVVQEFAAAEVDLEEMAPVVIVLYW